MEIWDDLIKQLTYAADQTIKEAEKLMEEFSFDQCLYRLIKKDEEN